MQIFIINVSHLKIRNFHEISWIPFDEDLRRNLIQVPSNKLLLQIDFLLKTKCLLNVSHIFEFKKTIGRYVYIKSTCGFATMQLKNVIAFPHVFTQYVCDKR